MALFVISYDLIKGKDYDRLTDRLKELDTVKTNLSVWYLSATNTALEVKDHLLDYIDGDDRIMVVEFSKKPAHTIGLKGTNDWLARFF